MASLPASRFYLETTPCSWRAALINGSKWIAYGEFAPDAKEAVAAFVTKHGGGATFVALVAPDQISALYSDAVQVAASRNRQAWETLAGQITEGVTGPLKVTVFDAASGGLPAASGDAPWIMAASEETSWVSVTAGMGEVGVKPTIIRQALSAQLGAVVESLRQTGATHQVAVVSLRRSSAVLALVSSQGVQALTVQPVGAEQLHAAVQAGLGLKFKAAAVKLFYNATYDFTETAPAIAEIFAAALKPGLTVLGGSPQVLQLAGLLETHAWVQTTLATSLGMTAWKGDASALARGQGLDVTEVLPASAIGLVQAVAGGLESTAAWLPAPLDEQPAVPATTASKPAAAPAPVAKAVPEVEKAVTQPVDERPAPKTAAPSAQPKPPVSAKPVAEPKAPVAVQASPAKSGKPVALIIGLVLAVLCGGIGVKLVSDKKAAQEQVAVDAEAAKIAAEQAARDAEVARAEAQNQALLRTELARDAMSFKNAVYSFEVTDKGFIRKLSTAGGQVLIDSAGAVNLQGSYVTPEGRRVWFYAGGVGNSSYTATVQKKIAGENIAFEVKVADPRFEFTQIITCLPHSVQVTVDFNPLNLQDPRGAISAIYAVQVWPAALVAAQSVKSSPGVIEYSTQVGPLAFTYGDAVWQTEEKEGKQRVSVGDTGTAFYFTSANEISRRKLNYELKLP